MVTVMPELLRIQKCQEHQLFLVTKAVGNLGQEAVNYAAVELPVPCANVSMSPTAARRANQSLGFFVDPVELPFLIITSPVQLIHSGQAELNIETFVLENSKDHIRVREDGVEGFQPKTEIEAGKEGDVSTSAMDSVIIKLCGSLRCTRTPRRDSYMALYMLSNKD